MITRLIDQTDPAALPDAVAILRKGGVVSFPTDTVYGIGGLAGSSPAIDRLFSIKGRAFDKPVPVMIGRMDQLELIASSIPPAAHRLAEKFWPGPLTLVLPKRPELPVKLTSLSGVGVRIPDHEFTLALLEQCGPLAVTSANRSGAPETHSASEVLEQLDGSLELVVDGGHSPGGTASTVVDLSGSRARILREGPITQQMIDQVLQDLIW